MRIKFSKSVLNCSDFLKRTNMEMKFELICGKREVNDLDDMIDENLVIYLLFTKIAALLYLSL